MNEYDIKIKPSKKICPKKYCFHWNEEGDVIAKGLHENLDEALINLKGIEKSKCGCSFGICTRDNSQNGDHDWYEPCEPILAQDNLPWFFFIPSPANLVNSEKQKYINESQLLWGNKYWEP